MLKPNTLQRFEPPYLPKAFCRNRKLRKDIPPRTREQPALVEDRIRPANTTREADEEPNTKTDKEY